MWMWHTESDVCVVYIRFHREKYSLKCTHVRFAKKYKIRHDLRNSTACYLSLLHSVVSFLCGSVTITHNFNFRRQENYWSENFERKFSFLNQTGIWIFTWALQIYQFLWTGKFNLKRKMWLKINSCGLLLNGYVITNHKFKFIHLSHHDRKRSFFVLQSQFIL